jgi:hypothetical protein
MRKDILIILIPSFIFVLAWIGFSIYHNFVTSTIPESVTMQITPITPDFDTKTIAGIKQRQNVTPVYQITNIVTVSPSPTPEVIQPTPQISSSSAQQATSGGNLSQ